MVGYGNITESVYAVTSVSARYKELAVNVINTLVYNNANLLHS